MKISRRLGFVCALSLMSASLYAQFLTPARPPLAPNLGVGARAQGMGGAFTALADDATASSWNPAGLAQLSRPEVSIVFDQIDVEQEADFGFDVTGPGLGTGITATEDINLSGEGDFSGLGFASFTYPFALGATPVVAQASYRVLSTFPELSSTYRYHDVITNAAGQVLAEEQYAVLTRSIPGGDINTYTLSLATSLARSLNVGLSVNYLDASYEDRRLTALDEGAATVFGEDTYRFDFSELFFDLGVQLKLGNRFSVGAVYHSDFDTDVETENVFLDDEDFTLIGDPIAATSNLQWPSGWAAGVAFRPTDRLTFSADYSQTNWGDAAIDEIAFALADCDEATGECEPVDIGPFGPAPFPALFVERQLDTESMRFGAEYVFASGQLLLPVRAGYFTEEQMINAIDESGDQPEYDGFSVGLGFVYSRFQIDLAYVHTEGDDVADPFTIEDEENGFTFVFPEVTQTTTTNRYVLSAIFRF